MGNMGFTPTNNPNQYLYNGKELQNDLDLGWYDYGARFYEPALGRWHCVDPLAESYYQTSPYSYVESNPLIYIDPNGMWKDPVNDPQYRGWYNLGWKPNQSKFGKTRGSNYHQGVDLYATVGTKIVAVEGGKIHQTSADSKISGFGNYIVLKFTKDKKTRYAVYAHLKDVDVKKGEDVKEGDKLGTTGKSGAPSNQPDNGDHLHFEIAKKWFPGTKKTGNDNREDPATYMTIEDASKTTQGNTKNNEKKEEKKTD